MPNLKKLTETIIVMIVLMIAIVFSWEGINYVMEDDLNSEKSCNVSDIKLYGGLFTYIPNEYKDENGIVIEDLVSSEDIVMAIEKAEENENIRVIIVEIDSLGGGPVAAEAVANALKRAAKPTVALIGENGLSAAYYAATGADIIFASENSAIGSIGVTMSYLDYAKENEKDGLTFNQLSAGKFKDTGNYDKPLTPEEKELFMRDIKILHENFIKAVADNRNIDIEKVRQFADGSDMLGQMALENGLIDQIGGRYEVEEYLKEKIGKDIEICSTE